MSVLWMQIVDDNDKLIGHKKRSEIDFQTEIYRVSALWLTNSRGQVLIAQRTLLKDRDAGKWGPAVAGTLEPGETYETNIYKEAKEEIGLSGVHFETGPKQRVRAPRNYFCQWFIASVDRDIDFFAIQPEEVAALAYITSHELIKEVAHIPDKYIPAMSEVLFTLNLK